jgi:methyl-accepting chemotaxis protein
MLKTFEQFISENYNEKSTTFFDEEYGSPFFNEVSESLISSINKNITEGNFVINEKMITEGLFDTVGKLFSKDSDKIEDKMEDGDDSKKNIEDSLSKYIKSIEGKDISEWDDIKFEDVDKETHEKIKSLCDYAKDICNDFSEREEKEYKTIGEKLTAVNEAIKQFMKKAINIIVGTIRAATAPIFAAIILVCCICKVMSVLVGTAIIAIRVTTTAVIRCIIPIIAITLPILLAYAVYKGVLKVCEKLFGKVKDGAKIVKDAFIKIKEGIVKWVSNSLKKVKDALKKTCDAVKDGAKKAYNAIGKSFIAIAALLGQLASDAKDAISDAYTDFINGAKEFTDEVKNYIKNKWDNISKWCNNTATAFADGVKNVWSKIKEKVYNVTGEVKESFQTFKIKTRMEYITNKKIPSYI